MKAEQKKPSGHCPEGFSACQRTEKRDRGQKPAGEFEGAAARLISDK
jgi:hypothetical protein